MKLLRSENRCKNIEVVLQLR